MTTESALKLINEPPYKYHLPMTTKRKKKVKKEFSDEGIWIPLWYLDQLHGMLARLYPKETWKFMYPINNFPLTPPRKKR